MILDIGLSESEMEMINSRLDAEIANINTPMGTIQAVIKVLGIFGINFYVLDKKGNSTKKPVTGTLKVEGNVEKPKI